MENAPDETSEPDPAAAHRAERARVRAEISPGPVAGGGGDGYGGDGRGSDGGPGGRGVDGATDVSRDGVTFPRVITSHRFGMGWYVALRRWIDRETRLTAGPALNRLASADRGLARALADERRRTAALEARVARLERSLRGVGTTPDDAGTGAPDPENVAGRKQVDDPWTPADAAP